MTVTGTVVNGKIELPPEVRLPDGMQISFELPPDAPPRKAATAFGEALLRLSGTVDDLPSDASINHDHYLYGAPKK